MRRLDHNDEPPSQPGMKLPRAQDGVLHDSQDRGAQAPSFHYAFENKINTV